jgi:hypothetical protein
MTIIRLRRYDEIRTTAPIDTCTTGSGVESLHGEGERKFTLGAEGVFGIQLAESDDRTPKLLLSPDLP